MQKDLKRLMELYLDEISDITKEGKLTPATDEAAMRALCGIEKIFKVHVWLEEEDEEQKWMENGYSERYSDRRGRGSNGRYISRMIDKLEDMKEEAPDFHSRKTITRAIDKLENQNLMERGD